VKAEVGGSPSMTDWEKPEDSMWKGWAHDLSGTAPAQKVEGPEF
jgi:hypothetical protein